MLTTVLETICDWLNREVCSQIWLMAPNDDNSRTPPKLVHPTAYPLFIPDKALLSKGENSLPAVVIQVLNGSDDPVKRIRTYQLRLVLISWSPGQYDALSFIKREKEKASSGELPYSFYQEAPQGGYMRNLGGWKDNANFAETVLSAFEEAEFIGEDKTIRLKKEDKLQFGHFQNEFQLLSFYPYWASYLTFSIEAGLVRKPPHSYQDLL